MHESGHYTPLHLRARTTSRRRFISVRIDSVPGERPEIMPKREGFDGLLVAAFESRLSTEMSRLIDAPGRRPMVAPSVHGIPLTENREALEFGDRLVAGDWDVLVLLTGVGLKTLVETLQPRHPRERIVEALGRLTRVCRGPKPVAALKALDLSPGITV